MQFLCKSHNCWRLHTAGQCPAQPEWMHSPSPRSLPGALGGMLSLGSARRRVRWRSKSATYPGLQVIVFLMKAGADVRGLSDKGNTALHYAALRGQFQVARMLLFRYNADALICNRKRQTALDIATLRLAKAEQDAKSGKSVNPKDTIDQFKLDEFRGMVALLEGAVETARTAPAPTPTRPGSVVSPRAKPAQPTVPPPKRTISPPPSYQRLARSISPNVSEATAVASLAAAAMEGMTAEEKAQVAAANADMSQATGPTRTTERLAELQQELNEKTESISLVETENEDLRKQKMSLETKIAVQQEAIDKLQSELAELSEQNQALSPPVAVEEVPAAALAGQVELHHKVVTEYEEKLDELSAQTAALEVELQTRADVLAKSLKENETYTARISDLEHQVHSLQEAMNTCTEDAERSRQELQACAVERDEALQRIRVNEDQESELRAALGEATEKLRSQEQDLAEKDAKLLAASQLETALTSKLQALEQQLHQTQAITREEIENTTVPQDDDSSKQADSVALLKAQAEVTAAQEALASARRSYEEAIAQCDHLTGQLEEAKVDARKQKEELTNVCETFKVEQGKVAEELEAVNAKNVQLQSKLDTKSEALKATESRVESLMQQMSTLKETAQSLEMQWSSAEEQHKAVKRALEGQEAQKLQMVAEIETLKKDALEPSEEEKARRAEAEKEQSHVSLISGGSVEGTIAQYASSMLPVFLEELNGSKDVSQRIEHFEKFIVYLRPKLRETFVNAVLVGQGDSPGLLVTSGSLASGRKEGSLRPRSMASLRCLAALLDFKDVSCQPFKDILLKYMTDGTGKLRKLLLHKHLQSKESESLLAALKILHMALFIDEQAILETAQLEDQQILPSRVLLLFADKADVDAQNKISRAYYGAKLSGLLELALEPVSRVDASFVVRFSDGRPLPGSSFPKLNKLLQSANSSILATSTDSSQPWFSDWMEQICILLDNLMKDSDVSKSIVQFETSFFSKRPNLNETERLLLFDGTRADEGKIGLLAASGACTSRGQLRPRALAALSLLRKLLLFSTQEEELPFLVTLRRTSQVLLPANLGMHLEAGGKNRAEAMGVLAILFECARDMPMSQRLPSVARSETYNLICPDPINVTLHVSMAHLSVCSRIPIQLSSTSLSRAGRVGQLVCTDSTSALPRTTAFAGGYARDVDRAVRALCA
eukprot:scaffold4547_cov335-Prasinococcus_capsulatus_cf.AAC.1